jgi:hypothetical protein
MESPWQPLVPRESNRAPSYTEHALRLGVVLQCQTHHTPDLMRTDDQAGASLHRIVPMTPPLPSSFVARSGNLYNDAMYSPSELLSRASAEWPWHARRLTPVWGEPMAELPLDVVPVAVTCAAMRFVERMHLLVWRAASPRPRWREEQEDDMFLDLI